MNRERQIMVLVVVFVLALLFGIGMPRLPAAVSGDPTVPAYIPP